MTTLLPEIGLASSERSTLDEFLDFYRAVARRKAEGLSDEQLRQRLPGHPSTMSIGAIIKHLASVETWWARGCFAGLDVEELDEPWRTGWQRTEGDWEWEAEGDRAADLLEWFDRAVANARATFAAADLDALGVRASREPGEGSYSLRWILVHLIEEYARNVGHLDLLRELADGVIGD